MINAKQQAYANSKNKIELIACTLFLYISK